MPRPKKPGAPEPKRRSRTGCWPCKTRKVKCDEARPVCMNCEKQNESCDYSIRLNWEGRGKKKLDSTSETTGEEQLDFSSGMITIGTSIESGTNVAATPTIPNIDFATFPGQLLFKDEVQGAERSGNSNRGLESSQTPLTGVFQTRTSEISMIDPAIMASITSPVFQDGLFSNNHSQQFTQSYERYGSSTPSTPLSGTYNDMHVTEVSASDRPHKRKRHQTSQDTDQLYDTQMPPPNPTWFLPYNIENSLNVTTLTSAPLTPTSSYSDDSKQKSHSAKMSPQSLADSPDRRRLSVSSLLSGPPGMSHPKDKVHGTPRSNPEQDWSFSEFTNYGIDRGIKDLDVGKNDDMNAISGSSPVSLRDHLDLVLDEIGETPVEFGFGNNSAFESGTGDYYKKPVSISIPRALEPLPAKLLENPMNLLYFHHFLNHTAGCLVPHNCSSNPFKNILPQMAVQDDNLLNLLLAYSALHRARLLRQPEPATRIALWVQDIFPTLRKALDDPSEIISNENLATAIMLASIEIISPKAFGVAIPWQIHLDTARKMIAARGGPLRMQTASRGDKVSSFLWSWFAYLDVLGSLSGGKDNSLSSSWILEYEIDDDDNDYQIDCILGFTSRCIRLLAKIAELARVCDIERMGPNLEARLEWKPSDDTIKRAEKLEADLADSRLHPARPCTHMQSTGEAAYHWDSLEMTATNEAFHWAGLVHLRRRILGKPSKHFDVQHAVREISGALCKVRRGSSAEACLLFPMFTAGCETQDERQRDDILERIKGVERIGMTQVHKARTLLERVWETGQPWETLVAGEFFG